MIKKRVRVRVRVRVSVGEEYCGGDDEDCGKTFIIRLCM